MKITKKRPISIIFTAISIVLIITLIWSSYRGYLHNLNAKKQQTDGQQLEYVENYLEPTYLTAGVASTNIQTLKLASQASVNETPTDIVNAENPDTEIASEPETTQEPIKDTGTTDTTINTVDEDELYMLSHLMFAEGGCDYYPDELSYYIGSVVLNRMASDDFPNTMKEVIFQKGQYECTWLGTYYNDPPEKCIEMARTLLQNGSMLPANVVFQAEFTQGSGTYVKIANTYFCYR